MNDPEMAGKISKISGSEAAGGGGGKKKGSKKKHI